MLYCLLTVYFVKFVFTLLLFCPPQFQTSWGHVQLDNCNFEGAQLQVRGPGTCQARFCSFSQGSSAHLMSVVLSLLDSCDFSGSDTASVIVEGPPVSERNWACKHLTALSRAFSSCSATENKDRPASGQLAGFTGGHQPPGADSKNEEANKEDWQQRSGGDTVCQGTVIEDCWSDCDRSEEEEGADGGGCNEAKNTSKMDYKIPCDNHGLSHLLEPRKAGSTPLDPPSVTPDLLTLQQELDRDPEAQMLAASTLGCIIRRCLFREGKGGVHLSNYGQARLEGNVFRGLNYAVRCIQNSTVSNDYPD